jgi:predicted NAD/FAD-dependent oxidoreductase
MATRRSSGFEIDHGAQYFTVREDAFRSAVNDWMDVGVAAPWEGRIAVLEDSETRFKSDQQPRYVGTPRMNSIVRHLARDLSTEFEARVSGLEKTGSQWCLVLDTADRWETFDAVILTTPPAQAAELLKGQNPFGKLLDRPMDPCWAVMAVFEPPLDIAFDAAFVNDSSLSWISRNSSKPDRDDQDTWVFHGSADWSRAHLDADRDWVIKELLQEFFDTAKLKNFATRWSTAHRWRYAQAVEPHQAGYFWDPETRLGVCGDWCNGSRVEGAFLSGRAIGKALIQA